MKHTTQQLYGISPHELKELTYEQALIACQQGARKRLFELMQPGFYQRNEPLISAVHKAQHWSESKLNELNSAKSTRFELFVIHIKYAFKALLGKHK